MLLQQIEHWAEETPQHPAHRHREQSLTYAELNAYSDALAVWLRERVARDYHSDHNKHKRLPVVIYGHKESEMPVLFLASVKAGHPYIPIDTSVPPERLRKILETSQAAAVLSPQVLPAAVKRSGFLWQEQIHLGDLHSLAPLGTHRKPEWQIGPDDVWYIIFTSGSTGEPKGVQITRRALESFVTWVNRQYCPRRGEEVFLNQAPFSFDLSVMDLYMSLSNGGTLWSVDREQIANARELFRSLAEAHLSYWVSTPSFAEMCLLDPGFASALLPDLRYFLFCGEVLPNDVASRLLARFPQARVINLYGPTEGTVAVSGVDISAEMAENSEPLPVGEHSPGCRIYICNSDELDTNNQSHLETDNCNRLEAGNLSCLETNNGGRLETDSGSRLETNNEQRLETVSLLKPLPAGEKGEIVIVGPNVSIGYLNHPELTRQAFFAWREEGGTQRAYRTGDIGCQRDGRLFYLGRRDFQIKLHGYRIELGEIEEQLRKLPGVENAIVLPLERRGKTAALQAFVKLCADITVLSAAKPRETTEPRQTTEPRETTEPHGQNYSFDLGQHLRKQLSRVLPAYMLPQRYIFIRNIPLTANGKVDRRALLGGHYDPV
ncbi:AMP-dependent synthetase/ligase [Acididesulfobacillus acetoxydans]|uniref:AMP-dependent synthetase/ligase n=1 Tax=Acididesulfobacillus acetoxydans TaxID=1561005 RepID=A0A8S0W485_9FIRM|nr:D-alanine--poly(phosphoribitol) ligase subunit DltA [Acididesulfobacillus acetoxydans]CAA7602298.1 AMP-dependent synthetase/ligase [Acididesulfobacillus acetoxydans]CEJ07484.1 D-alanine--poly(phosphoribitol) ligase subunit 1 [Acididesulfobacillus acetoxydans]